MNMHQDSPQNFKWPVKAERIIKAPKERLWSVIAAPENLNTCHPFCETNEVVKWPGTGSHDTLRYYNGRYFERKFVNWVEGEGYDLLIGAPGEETSFVSWRISAAENDRSRLQITVFPYLVQHFPLALRWLPHVMVVDPLIRRYLDSVVLGFAWFIETGTPVRKNQFGSHPWFSNAQSDESL